MRRRQCKENELDKRKTYIIVFGKKGKHPLLCLFGALIRIFFTFDIFVKGHFLNYLICIYFFAINQLCCDDLLV